MTDDLRPKLRQIRDHAGLSQDDVAKATGVGRSQISLIETSARQTTLDVLIRWAAACEHDVVLVPNSDGGAALSALVGADRELVLRLAEVLPRLPEALREDLESRLDFWTNRYVSP